jgi:hypothetical protein
MLHESAYIVLGLGAVLVALKALDLSLLGLVGHMALVALASCAQVPQGHSTWRVWPWRVCTRQGLDCNISAESFIFSILESLTHNRLYA